MVVASFVFEGFSTFRRDGRSVFFLAVKPLDFLEKELSPLWPASS